MLLDDWVDVFCVKRMFSGYICAVEWCNIVKGLLLGALIYNFFMKMNLR